MRGKGRIALMAVFLLVGILSGCAGHHSSTVAVFARGRLQFEQVARQVLEQGSAQNVEYPEGVRSIRIYRGSDETTSTVEFLCGANGLGSSTSYWGINYVVGDTPTGFQGFHTEYWKKEGNGTRFYEVESDNSCYVERLEKNWFYFEMKF